MAINGKLLSGKCLFALTAVLLLMAASVFARGLYQSNDEFLQEVFQDELPGPLNIWMRGEVKSRVADILGHHYAGLRVRYWQQEGRSAWILKEVGKEQPITFGIVVSQNKVEQVKVLAYRESRGEEIRYPFFTGQFVDAQLQDNKLSHYIDGISGATLSVRAMTKTVKLALYLDSLTVPQVQKSSLEQPQ